jgi:hypothetical protein
MASVLFFSVVDYRVKHTSILTPQAPSPEERGRGSPFPGHPSTTLQPQLSRKTFPRTTLEPHTTLQPKEIVRRTFPGQPRATLQPQEVGRGTKQQPKVPVQDLKVTTRRPVIEVIFVPDGQFSFHYI